MHRLATGVREVGPSHGSGESHFGLLEWEVKRDPFNLQPRSCGVLDRDRASYVVDINSRTADDVSNKLWFLDLEFYAVCHAEINWARDELCKLIHFVPRSVFEACRNLRIAVAKNCWS